MKKIVRPGRLAICPDKGAVSRLFGFRIALTPTLSRKRERE